MSNSCRSTLGFIRDRIDSFHGGSLANRSFGLSSSCIGAWRALSSRFHSRLRCLAADENWGSSRVVVVSSRRGFQRVLRGCFVAVWDTGCGTSRGRVLAKRVTNFSLAGSDDKRSSARLLPSTYDGFKQNMRSSLMTGIATESSLFHWRNSFRWFQHGFRRHRRGCVWGFKFIMELDSIDCFLFANVEMLNSSIRVGSSVAVQVSEGSHFFHERSVNTNGGVLFLSGT